MIRAGASLFLSSVAVAAAQGEDSLTWQEVLKVPPQAEAGIEAWSRWKPGLEAMARLSEEDVSCLAARSGEQVEALATRHRDAIEAFAVSAGEQVSLSRPVGPEAAIGEGATLRRLALLKAAWIRTQWRSGVHDAAVRSAADLVRVGAELADDACSVPGFLTGLGVLDSGLETIHWMEMQSDAGGADFSDVCEALAHAEVACLAGSENALRGEFHFVFRVVLERMPESSEPGLLLARFSTLGIAHPTEDRLRVNLELDGSGRVLLDHAQTVAIYGEALAEFITAQRMDDAWRRDRFAAPWTDRVRRWKGELPALTAYAVGEELGTMSEAARGAIAAELARVENPFGKLLLMMMAADVDGIAGAGMRARDRVREGAKQLGGVQRSPLAPMDSP